ncbi:hypothetical protein FACS1894211_01630 [Clostridia bacterium]|nr:hypothetical protein FACS1894211_01630 [Clostridia bacterium]
MAERTIQTFFNWAYKGRAANLKKISDGVEQPPEKIFLSFTSHTPTFVSNGSKGLNASIKGIGFVPKQEYLAKILPEYIEHIKSYKEGDKEYGTRGAKILHKHLYSEEAEKNIDFSVVTSLEMAFVHSWYNYRENPEATLLFYQPPMISFELRGKMEIRGKRYAKEDTVPYGELDIYQQFVNAQHDMYHAPNIERWKTRPAYVFHIEEAFDNGAGPEGFGKQLKI